MHGGDNNQKVEDVFKDFKARRAGILKALTTEVREFFQQCDPVLKKLIIYARKKKESLSKGLSPTHRNDDALNLMEHLCLYGLPNEQWAVKEPVENVPPEIPEPALGINFARDGMQQKEWLSIVALHSDTWLLAVAFYYSSYFKFDKADRARLFDMMNDLPTLLEVVEPAEKQQKGKEKSTVSNRSTNRSKSSSKSSVNPRKSSKRRPKYEEADMDDVEYDDDGGGNTLCGGCGGKYADDVDEFWICCDVCEIWFHGKCVRITPSQAEHIDKYKCPACNGTKRPPF